MEGQSEEKKLSKCLLLLNLQRPFANSSLEALLNKYGKIERFWLDYKKTYCYVEVKIKLKMIKN